jgi:hypothetical protein
LFRPVALDVLGMPFGSHNSPNLALVQAEGSPHCELLADCETVSIANAGLNLATTSFLLVLTGFVIVIALSRSRIRHSWAPMVPNPPPLPVFS